MSSATAAPMAFCRHAVDVAEQVEAVLERQVPPERSALPEDDADAAGDLDAPAARIETTDADLAGRRDEDAGAQFHGRRFPGAVRTQVAEQLPARTSSVMPSTAFTTWRSRRRRPARR